jgi:hypothetical protein
MNLIEQAQSHYNAWRAAIVDRLAILDRFDNAENDELARKATVLAGEHSQKLLSSKCASKHSARLKFTVARYYIRLYGPVGDEAQWAMVESGMADLVSDADLPSIN